MGIENQSTTKMGIERKDYTGVIQRYREKKNISYKLKDGREIFAKFANYQDGSGVRNNLEGIKKEAEILSRLENTGVTPKVIQIKNYPNEKMARLVTEKISGNSLDRLEVKLEERNSVFANVITSSAESLQKIHDEGIYMVDINKGTFLVNNEGQECKVVDFELGVDSSNTNEEEIKKAVKFRQVGYPDILGYETLNTLESVKQKEMYTWAQTMLDFISDKTGVLDIAQTDFEEKELPEEIRSEYQNYIESIRDRITNYVTKVAEKEVQNPNNQEQARRWYDNRRDSSITFEEYLDELKTKEIKNKTKRFLNNASLNITLKYRLEKLGINLPETKLRFLEKCLDMDPSKRPDSFKELIVENKI